LLPSGVINDDNDQPIETNIWSIDTSAIYGTIFNDLEQPQTNISSHSLMLNVPETAKEMATVAIECK